MSSESGNGHAKRFDRYTLDLSNHSAVVTGAARGIARATCVALAQEGVRSLACVDQSADVEALAAEINAQIGRPVAAPFRGDVTDSVFRRSVFAEMERRGVPVSICVPAAGITRDRLSVRIAKETGEADIYPEADFRRVIDIDLIAPIYWSLETIASVARARHRAGAKRWEPSEGVQGCIVLIGSVSSEGNKGQISYASAKAGLEGAQATLAAEAIFYGVRCAIIHPGYTDTAMVRTLGEQFIREHIIPQTQLRRLILPEEIAHAICFMIRNAAVSGTLWVDAGWHPTV